MQALVEKMDAIRSLLPALTEHLHRHRHYRITPRAQWVTEGGEPPQEPHAPCDERCVGCELHCPDEGWVTEYRRLRRAYPVIRRLERLLELQITYVPDGRRWKAAIVNTYLYPWSLMQQGDWPALCDAGVRWLAEQCGGEVPVFEGAVQLRRARDVQAEVVALRDRGLSVRQIAQRTGVGRESVRRLLAKLGRLERTPSAVG